MRHSSRLSIPHSAVVTCGACGLLSVAVKDGRKPTAGRARGRMRAFVLSGSGEAGPAVSAQQLARLGVQSRAYDTAPYKAARAGSEVGIEPDSDLAALCKERGSEGGSAEGG